MALTTVLAMGMTTVTASAAVGTNSAAKDNAKQSLQYINQVNAVRAKTRKVLTPSQISAAIKADSNENIPASMIPSISGNGKPVATLKVNSDMTKWAQTRANELAKRAVTHPNDPISHSNMTNGRPSWCDDYNLSDSDQYQGGYFFGPENLAISYPEYGSSYNPVSMWFNELNATSTASRQGYGHYLAMVSPYADIVGFGVAKVSSGSWKGATVAVMEIGNSKSAQGKTQTVAQALADLDKDTTKPVITGADNVSLKAGKSFNPRAGVTARDDRDGDITAKIQISGSVNTTRIGKYTLVYTVSDKAGNKATITRTVTVRDPNVFVDSLAVRRGNTYYFKYTISGGQADAVAAYGKANDTVLVGDWNGDRVDTLAVRRGNLYYVKNSISGGQADKVIGYGKANDTVLVGDWNGDGKDTLAVRRGNLYYIKDSISGGKADKVIAYGRANDTILVGDWDGDGKDTLAVRRGNTYYVKNSISGGQADRVIGYGRASDTVLVGDWDGNKTDSLAVRRGNTYYIKNSISGGAADKVVGYGRANDIVLVGAWE
ncbi:immunoglobulin-like domain-containing protein [Bifidobacterium primatium]|uniref:immunoglobulin-like domain-containing protein n=1 Tax=Bifidobacterium primatium TaxID=2045438 RepID=UPI0013FDEAFC|nr:immunoglobulin-like domain-containing protein [Bifidobacterium primatium]